MKTVCSEIASKHMYLGKNWMPVLCCESEIGLELSSEGLCTLE